MYLVLMCLFFPNCAGHKDSVTCTAFSHDSKLVATGDMSGLITVWDVATQKEVWNFETTDLEVKLQALYVITVVYISFQ